MQILIDILLALSLLWLANLSLNIKDNFKSIILFIIFGLFMALVWIRLNAPDIALAEAVIGAGITGALLMEFLRFLKMRNDMN